jgi:replicative DNA helicase
MDVLVRNGKYLGDVATFREDGTLTETTLEWLRVKRRKREEAQRMTRKRAKHLLRVLLEHRQARILLKGAERFTKICMGKRNDTSIERAQNAAIEMLKALREDRSKKITHYGQGRTREQIKAEFKQFFKYDERRFVSTGLNILDEAIGGYARGDLVVVTAPRGGGKTALSLQMAINQFRAGHNVGFVSLEMSEDQLKERMVANITDTNASKVRARALSRSEKSRIFREWIRFEMDTAAKYSNRFTPWDIKDPTYRADNIELDLGPFGYDVIIIDYITLLSANTHDLWASQKETGRYLKQLAGRLNCVIVVLTQMNKDEGVKYGSGPEEDADWWIRWRYGEEEKTSGEVDIELAKARHGKAVSIKTYFRMDRMQVECSALVDPAASGSNGSAAVRKFPDGTDSPLDSKTFGPKRSILDDDPEPEEQKSKPANKKKKRAQRPTKARDSEERAKGIGARKKRPKGKTGAVEGKRRRKKPKNDVEKE